MPVATMPIRINVRQATGDIFPIEIDDSCTVRELKDKVEGKCGVKACHQELRSRKLKKTLEDGSTTDLPLSTAYPLVGGETIELTDLSSVSIPIKLDKVTKTVTFQQGNLTTIKELRAKVVELADGCPKGFRLGFGENLAFARQSAWKGYDLWRLQNPNRLPICNCPPTCWWRNSVIHLDSRIETSDSRTVHGETIGFITYPKLAIML